MPQKISRRSFLGLTGGALAVLSVPGRAESAADHHPPAMLDHILLGCNDLDRGIDFVEQHTGVRPAFGGVHPGRGTRNALLFLGERSRDELNPRRYLEIIAPDPAQSGTPDRYGLQKLTEPRLIGWAAHPGNLDQFAARLRDAGLAFDGPTPGSRKRPDGRLLQWKTLNLHDDRGGLLPFFIEWSADTTHPSVDAPRGCHLESFELLTPDPDALTKTADQLGLGVAISKAATPEIRAVIKCAANELQLTS
ncbi:MAG TPA: VOC family protein [Candidatus Methylomirabilis sp.]|nr:VOC family protein [Candidatus Methylomirabilis sp.]